MHAATAIHRRILAATVLLVSGLCVIPCARANSEGEERGDAAPAALAPATSPDPVAVARERAATPQRSAERARLKQLKASEGAFYTALAAQLQGDLRAAESAYRKALTGDAGFVEARVNLARVLLARGELDAAARELERAARDEPDYPALHAARARLALERRDWVRARGALDRALALDPEQLEARVNLAGLLLQQGRLGEARVQLERALELEPQSVEVLFNRALLEDLSERHGEAAYFYALFLELAPADDPLRAGVTARLRELGAAPPEANP